MTTKLPWNAERVTQKKLEKRLGHPLREGYRTSDGKLQVSCSEGVFYPEEGVLYHWIIGCSDEVAGR